MPLWYCVNPSSSPIAAARVRADHCAFCKAYSYDGISCMFRRYVKKCGLKDFGLYDLKGKAATDMYRSGVRLEQVQHLLGHTSVKTTEIYIEEESGQRIGPLTA